ncbi:oxidoreductase [Liquorilactobacillus sucicola DSM 21376 = JCM 15457]|nr:oxidoreductase [Liquorilactobacillus sucicola DSM 21376 = JCM 15457]
MTKYGVVVGSIRKNSYSKGVADAIVAGLPEGSDVTYLDIASLPLYNQDYDADSPAVYTKFRDEVKAQDAFIFVTPEHNRSIPAALKNALDVASRPWGQNVWLVNQHLLLHNQFQEFQEYWHITFCVNHWSS